MAGDPWDSWINPTSILGGVLAVTVCAYLAAVYMVWDARRLGHEAMVEYFRRRAVVAAIVAGVVAAGRHLRAVRRRPRTCSTASRRARSPLVILSAICGIGSLVLLLRENHAGARVLAMGAVATVVIGWGVAQ